MNRFAISEPFGENVNVYVFTDFSPIFHPFTDDLIQNRSVQKHEGPESLGETSGPEERMDQMVLIKVHRSKRRIRITFRHYLLSCIDSQDALF